MRDVIAAHGLAAKKSLGQNFLLDLNLTRRIARAAGPLEGATIYEVGPGPGGLTRALLMEGAARVIAVERDTRCIAALEEIAKAYPGRLDIVEDDALAIDETELLRARNVSGPLRIASNLPYNIGSALLVKWLTQENWPPFWQSLTLMFQREVAQRLVAQPGNKDYGRLSILTQWRARHAFSSTCPRAPSRRRRKSRPPSCASSPCPRPSPKRASKISKPSRRQPSAIAAKCSAKA